VTNTHGLSSTSTLPVLVKDDIAPEIDVLAWYPLNVDVKDYGGHGYNAVVEGASKANDAEGRTDFAYRITTGDDIIYVPNALALNFVDEITVACWISVSPTGREAFILSHGSWEKRWKLSLTPDNHVRWTVKTGSGTVDLDSREPVTANRFYHVAATYSGYSLELYIDGELDNFTELDGSIQQADDPITFGQKGMDETQYYLNGVIDEVRIYNEALQPWQIASLKTLWHDEVVTGVEGLQHDVHAPFPNPVVNDHVSLYVGEDSVLAVRMISAVGKMHIMRYVVDDHHIVVEIGAQGSGLVVMEVETAAGVQRYKVLVP
jgi:hypothetical protein